MRYASRRRAVARVHTISDRVEAGRWLSSSLCVCVVLPLQRSIPVYNCMEEIGSDDERAGRGLIVRIVKAEYTQHHAYAASTYDVHHRHGLVIPA